MASFKVRMKDGTVRDFPHAGRAGGSYTKSIEYVPGFVVITNEWGTKTSIPAADIAEVEERPERSW